MRHDGSVDYALARLGARLAARAAEADWHRIEVAREAATLLDAARAIPAFAPWVAGTRDAADVHDFESRWRARWRDLALEIAGWMPARWQPPVAWCAVLDSLPALAHLARGGAPSAWMLRDRRLGPLLEAGGTAGLRPALARSALAALASAWDEPSALHAAWVREWRRRLPPMGEDDQAALADLARLLARHRRTCAATTGGDAWPMRRLLAAALAAHHHRSVGSPAAVFSGLVLLALDAERLRGEIVRRLAFPRLALAA